MGLNCQNCLVKQGLTFGETIVNPKPMKNEIIREGVKHKPL